MATVPDKERPAPTPAARVRDAAAEPRYRLPAFLAVAAAAGALAPAPFASLLAALLVLAAWDAARRR